MQLNNGTNEKILENMNAAHERSTDNRIEVSFVFLQKHGTFSYNMKWETYARTKFGNLYVNDMFDLIYKKPSRAPCRKIVRGNIPAHFGYVAFNSKNMASFSKMADRTLKSGCYFAGIIQIDSFQEYYELFYETEFYVMLFSYTIICEEKCIVARTFQYFPQTFIDLGTFFQKHGDQSQEFLPKPRAKFYLVPSLGLHHMSE